ncbi:hypothetical protein UlMin_002649, partial [Ulmus minor]
YVKGCIAQWENQQLIVAASLPCPVFRLQLVGGSLSSPLSRVSVQVPSKMPYPYQLYSNDIPSAKQVAEHEKLFQRYE